MHKHLKTAFIIAPILAVFGYVGADYYHEYEADKMKLVELVPEGQCDVINQSCVLSSGEFKVSVSDEAGVTEVNSTFPLDSATLFLVDEQDKVTAYPLGMQKTPYYWRSQTNLRRVTSGKGDSHKLRLIAKIKGGQYISEFFTETTR